MKRYQVYAEVVSYVDCGVVEASSEEEAEDLAWEKEVDLPDGDAQILSMRVSEITECS